MKSVLFSLLVLAMPASSFACLGGSITTLQIGEREIGRVDITTGTVEITELGVQLTSVSYQSNAGDQNVLVCAQNADENTSCSSPVSLQANLSLNQNGVLRVRVRITADGEENDVNFKLTDFQIAKDMNSCGPIVQPSSN